MKTILMSGVALVMLGGCQYWHDMRGHDGMGHHDEMSSEDMTAEDAMAEDMAEPAEEMVEAVVEMAAPTGFAALLSHADRPADDAEDDAARNPAHVLEFAGVTDGMHIYEVEAGGGYYTELLSRAVGPEGSVLMQNPVAFDAFLGDAVAERLAGGRLGNVTLRKSNFDDFYAEAGSKDMVTWILGPHELWFTPDDGASLGSPEAAFGQISGMLKTGGTFIVVDHAADAGAPSSTGGETHRIDPQIIKDMAADVGLEFVGSSDVLANSDDDHSVMVFDPSVRRKTDRFILKFVKS